jgi:pyruvate/2-oxoglutarate/acetoin dehydrogenase E1 component
MGATKEQREQKQQERLEAQKLRRLEEEKTQAEFRAKLPLLVFELMVKAAKLNQEGVHIESEVVQSGEDTLVKFNCNSYDSYEDYDKEIINLTTSDQWDVERVEIAFDRAKEAMLERKRQQELRQTAMAKLSKEELKALGLA